MALKNCHKEIFYLFDPYFNGHARRYKEQD